VFNLSGSEVIIILILALVILGPDKLPDAMRRAGRTWAELRKLSSGFQEEVRKGFEEPTKEVRQTADAVRKAAALPSKKLRYNPLKDPLPALPDGESVAEPETPPPVEDSGVDPVDRASGEATDVDPSAEVTIGAAADVDPSAEVTIGAAADVDPSAEVSTGAAAEAPASDDPGGVDPRATATDESPAAS
jgi:sec-independent protein translocase protein TatB